ncbi:MAG: hypothetical protein QXK27_00675 [Candidatus Hadarchaeales archaeon]
MSGWKLRDCKGQIFTLDTFFAIGVFALAVAQLGVVFSEVYGRSHQQWMTHSLERIANDAADILVYTAGTPLDWADNLATLRVPGLTENSGSEANRCVLDPWRISRFKQLIENDFYSGFVRERLFGNHRFLVRIGFRKAVYQNGSYAVTENFLLCGEMPENAVQAAKARRPVLLRGGGAKLFASVDALLDNVTENQDNLSFSLTESELSALDLYIRVSTDEASPVDNVRLGVNGDPPSNLGEISKGYIYLFTMGAVEGFPNPSAAGHWVSSGGIENDVWLNPFRLPHAGVNQIQWVVRGEDGDWASIQVIGVPSGLPATLVRELDPEGLMIGFVEVIVWR